MFGWLGILGSPSFIEYIRTSPLTRISSNCHISLNILKGRETLWNREGKLNELQVLQALSIPQELSSQHCITLVDHFYQPGVDVEDGEHLCLATELMGGTLTSVRKSSPHEFIPIDAVKRILRHILLGMVGMHARGIAHTGS
jgi:serine/threonine-protein kinase SRPK3